MFLSSLFQVNGDYAYDRYDPSGGKFYCKGHIQFKKHHIGPLVSPQKEVQTLAAVKVLLGNATLFIYCAIF